MTIIFISNGAVLRSDTTIANLKDAMSNSTSGWIDIDCIDTGISSVKVDQICCIYAEE
jgi:hypothetical protein